MAKLVAGLFDHPEDARDCVRQLRAAGFNANDISLVARGEGGIGAAPAETEAALAGAGIPESDARVFADHVDRGGALIFMEAQSADDAGRAAEIINGYYTGRGGPAPAATRDAVAEPLFEQGGELRVPVVEERLRVDKREVEAGGVRVSTWVEQSPVNEQVNLRDEKVRIERVAADRPASAGALDAWQETTFEIRERHEQAVITKEARVVEEIRIQKDVEQRTEQVQEVVRRTAVEVEELGDGALGSARINDDRTRDGTSSRLAE